MDKKFLLLKNELIQKGLTERNFDYLYNAIKAGTKREFIYKNLISDVRKTDPNIANEALDKFYKLNGGEFKYENRTGYMYSATYLLISLISLLMIYTSLNSNVGSIKFLIAMILIFIVFSYKSATTIYKSVQGKHRE